MPIDHVNLVVPQEKFDAVIAFVLAALAPLGYKEMMRPIPTAVGIGDVAPIFWINAVEGVDPEAYQVISTKTHLAFTAKDAKQVQQFHAAALKAGGTCNGPPGIREHYHPNYYGTFVLDPECGVNFEVVCHTGSG